MKKLKVKNNVKPQNNITTLNPNDCAKEKLIQFNFSKFNYKSVNIPGKFNNNFKNDQQLNEVLKQFVIGMLPSFSSETYNSLTNNNKKRKILHFHKLDSLKYELLKDVLKKYEINNDAINDLLGGENIYQMSSGSKGHLRIVVQIVSGLENEIYPLFFDVNHHFYIDKTKIGESLKYSYKCICRQSSECIFETSLCDKIENDTIEKSFENRLELK